MEKQITLQTQPWKSKYGAKLELLGKVKNLPPTPEGLEIRLSTPIQDDKHYHPRLIETSGEETADGGFLEGIARLLFIPPRGYRAIDTLTLKGDEELIETYIRRIAQP